MHPDRLTLFGVNARPTKNEDNGADEIAFRLTHAVRFPMKKDNKLEMADLPAGSTPPGWRCRRRPWWSRRRSSAAPSARC